MTGLSKPERGESTVHRGDGSGNAGVEIGFEISLRVGDRAGGGDPDDDGGATGEQENRRGEKGEQDPGDERFHFDGGV